MKRPALPRLGLLPRILIAMLLGILLSTVMPVWMIRVFATLNGIFGNFLTFAIPLVILSLVTSAIADTESGAGRMLVVTFILAYTSTIIAGLLSYLIGSALFPGLIDRGIMAAEQIRESQLTPFFSAPMPAVMDIMSALVLSFLMGLGIFYTRSRVLHGMATELKAVISRLISAVIIPLLPLYIFGLFLLLAASGEAMRIVMVFIKIIGIIFLMHIGWLLLLYSAAGAVARKNPLRLLKTMLPAYLTALATQSSVATLPVTLQQARNLGSDSKVVDFTIPLCANIHLSGSMLKIVACALALMVMHGQDYSLALFTEFILILAITMVAAPGVPGGAIMAALSILSSVLGFSQEDQALMISLYIAMDNFGTACNVTGDGAITCMVDAVMRKIRSLL